MSEETAEISVILSKFIESIQNTLDMRINQLCDSIDKLDANIKELKMEDDKSCKEMATLSAAINKLEDSIHHPPCETMLKHLSDHSRIDNEKHEVKIIRKKFIANVLTIVVAALILGGLSALFFAFKAGYNPLEH